MMIQIEIGPILIEYIFIHQSELVMISASLNSALRKLFLQQLEYAILDITQYIRGLT